MRISSLAGIPGVRFFLSVLAILAIALCVPRSILAQQLEDVVYLKDGSIIRGTIVETRPGESILIRTRDGNQFRYTMAQIDRTTKEPAVGVAGAIGGNAKSPGLAWFLSFILPGAGQAYNGQWGKGAAFFGGAVLGYGLVVAAAVDCSYDYYDYSCSDSSSEAALGAVLFLGSWVWSQIDAPVTASKINRGLRGTASLEFQPRMVALHRATSPLVGAAAGRGTSAKLGLSLATIRF